MILNKLRLIILCSVADAWGFYDRLGFENLKEPHCMINSKNLDGKMQIKVLNRKTKEEVTEEGCGDKYDECLYMMKIVVDEGKVKSEEIILDSRKRKRVDEEIRNETEEGYVVDQSSWNTFMVFITSKEELNKLPPGTLSELCNSLALCAAGDDSNKGSVVTKLTEYSRNIRPSLQSKPNWVPGDLMTVYCSTPGLFCENDIPQNLAGPEIRRRRRMS